MSSWIPRLQLFELEDLEWFPAVIRDLATDYLRAFEERFGLDRHARPILEGALRDSGATEIVDLCSGGGGPLVTLRDQLAESGLPVRVTLTDLYPNLEAFERAHAAGGESIDFVSTPVDARKVPPELRGFRTFFNAFHHFGPRDAREILADAVDDGQPIGIFEVPERTLRMAFGVVLQPILVWGFTPMIRPMRWRRLFWTYIVPAVPLTCLWDGMVSMFRAYTVDELVAMSAELGSDRYVWRAGEHAEPGVAGKLTYLIGMPAERL